eukprot:TRINITY_DN5708_c5_g1_i1.p1 TRINITY_DN5708_c5_g1~~TRINITY_DN5708_c5_g1_i1.p1  ORF type:complete len:342 (-),score=41.83 TRINITY_DN5708_c5_g1_i1:337-1362(-)
MEKTSNQHECMKAVQQQTKMSEAITRTTFAPIERVKLLLQTQWSDPDIQSGRRIPYKGPWDCAIRVYSEEGALSFWRGNMANVYRTFSHQAFNFAFYARLKAPFPKIDAHENFWQALGVNVARGSVAGGLSQFVLYPIDFVRTRLGIDIARGQDRREFTGIVDVVRKVVGRGGIVALYAGFGVSFQGAIVYRGIYFGGYETIRNYRNSQHKHQQQQITPNHSTQVGNNSSRILVNFLIAQIVTVIGQLAAYPFDTVRRRLMQQSGNGGGNTVQIYKGPWDCWKRIYLEEGVGGFYKGVSMGVFNWIGAALLLTFYDEMQGLMNGNGFSNNRKKSNSNGAQK